MKKYKLPFAIEAQINSLFSFDKQIGDYVEVADNGRLNIIDTAGCLISPHYVIDEYDKLCKLFQKGKLEEIKGEEVIKLSPKKLALALSECSSEELLQVASMYEYGKNYSMLNVPEELRGKELLDFIKNLDSSVHGICESLSEAVENEYSSLCMKEQWQERFAEEREGLE